MERNLKGQPLQHLKEGDEERPMLCPHSSRIIKLTFRIIVGHSYSDLFVTDSSGHCVLLHETGIANADVQVKFRNG